MAKKRTGGLGRGFDALFSESDTETMGVAEKPAAPAPAPAPAQEEQPAQVAQKAEEAAPAPAPAQPAKSVERIVVRDAELEELAAAELAAAQRAAAKAEEEAKQAAQQAAAAAKAQESDAVQNAAPSSEKAMASQAEEAEKAQVVERVVDRSAERRKPTKRTAASEAEKARKLNAVQIEEAQNQAKTVQVRDASAAKPQAPAVQVAPQPAAAQRAVTAAPKESAPAVQAAAVEEKPAAKPAVSKPAETQTAPAAKPAEKKAPAAVAQKATPQKKKLEEGASDEVPLDSIRPNPDQPRTHFKREDIEELAASIERDGLLQPILVRPMGEGKYQIIAGERRWQACKEIGLKKVPVRIKQADDNLALELALIENIQRTDLNPIEEAYGYRRIMERRKITQSELAQLVSKGRSTVANALRLLDLPEDAQQLLYEEKITAGHARAILAVPTSEGRQKLTEKLVKESLSVRETESLARLYAGREKKEGETKRTPVPKEYKMVARQLKAKLDAPVRVKTSQGKNKIEIEFKDNADLERLMGLIAGE